MENRSRPVEADLRNGSGRENMLPRFTAIGGVVDAVRIGSDQPILGIEERNIIDHRIRKATGCLPRCAQVRGSP